MTNLLLILLCLLAGFIAVLLITGAVVIVTGFIVDRYQDWWYSRQQYREVRRWRLFRGVDND